MKKYDKQLLLNWGKQLQSESGKSFADKVESGFFDKYMFGKGLDVGYKGGFTQPLPILQSTIGVDIGYPGYNGKDLPFENDSMDYVYSSHTLEHIVDYQYAIKEWFRVLRVGGHLIIVVPVRDLYERKMVPPSRWNGDHKRFYSAGSLLREIEESLQINSYRVRHLYENDKGHDYNQSYDRHALGCYEIEIVLEKISNNPRKLDE